MQKQLLITFDYELFLGNRSGSINDCLLGPTKDLMQVLKKHGVHAVFFVDTTYLLRLKELTDQNLACKEDFNKISGQLCEMIRQGHFVYPHIHPHWLDAEYIKGKNQWKLVDKKKYRFHDITTEERSKIFSGSIHLLKMIIHPTFPEYKIDAYRAGGWCIQPFLDFLPFFEQFQFRYEFSVMAGFYQFTDAHYFDFSNAPVKSVYRFEKDVCKEVPDGPFVQFNISSLEVNSAMGIFNKIWLKWLYKIFKDHTFDKGEGLQTKELTGIFPAAQSGRNLDDTQWERISVELLTAVKLHKYLHFISKNGHMHFISHPKMITRHNLKVFDKFLGKVFKKYSIETDFHLMIP